MARSCARSGSSASSSALAQAEQPTHAHNSVGQNVAAVGSEGERLGPQHGGKIERRIEMRERCAAARSLPFQVGAETLGIDGEQHEAVLPGEMRGERGRKLMARRKDG